MMFIFEYCYIGIRCFGVFMYIECGFVCRWISGCVVNFSLFWDGIEGGRLKDSFWFKFFGNDCMVFVLLELLV